MCRRSLLLLVNKDGIFFLPRFRPFAQNGQQILINAKNQLHNDIGYTIFFYDSIHILGGEKKHRRRK